VPRGLAGGIASTEQGETEPGVEDATLPGGGVASTEQGETEPSVEAGALPRGGARDDGAAADARDKERTQPLSEASASAIASSDAAPVAPTGIRL
jgi:hypothetical protein